MRPTPSSAAYTAERDACLNYFSRWNETDQVITLRCKDLSLCMCVYGKNRSYSKERSLSYSIHHRLPISEILLNQTERQKKIVFLYNGRIPGNTCFRQSKHRYAWFFKFSTYITVIGTSFYLTITTTHNGPLQGLVLLSGEG